MSKKYYLILLALVVLGVGIVGMPRQEYGGDPMMVRCETVSLINTGSLAIPTELARSCGERGQFFVENVEKGTWYCKYGILNGLLYFPFLSLQKWHEGKLEYSSPSRVIYLNCFNFLVSLATAFFLFLIAHRYTQYRSIAFLYVLTAFYTTYWWNYLRAHNSEIYQTLFMLGFYYYLVRSWDEILQASAALKTGSDKNSQLRKQEILAGLFFSALILVKTFYIVLLPLLGVFFIVRLYERSPRGFSSLQKWLAFFSSACSFGMPVVLALGVILMVNNYKFGSPFESGYGQWQERMQPIFSGSFFSGLSHFFFDPQFSMFLCFPIFFFALFGYPSFFRVFRRETALFVAMGLTILLLNSKLLAWSGAWCYGPRYLLVMLPLVSLPFLKVLEWLFENWKEKKRILLGILIASTLLFSLKLQMNVNALPFFVYFRLKEPLASLHDPEIDRYFAKKPFPFINQDLLAFKNEGKPLPFLSSIERRMSPEERQQLYRFILSELRSNYYWFGD